MDTQIRVPVCGCGGCGRTIMLAILAPVRQGQNYIASFTIFVGSIFGTVHSFDEKRAICQDISHYFRQLSGAGFELTQMHTAQLSWADFCWIIHGNIADVFHRTIMADDVDRKGQTQERFGRYAQAYVVSPTHTKGYDLERLLELAQPQPDWMVLDVATGGGHTALKFAPLVAQVVASDLTPTMLEAARQFIDEQGTMNVRFTTGDAENLPFAPAMFDLVTCRIAPHHFPDCFQFVLSCARVLKPGGLLLVEDQLKPDDERAGYYVNAFERLRDPSHHQTYAAYEWQGMFLDAGLTVEHTETLKKTDRKMIPWAEVQGCSPAVIERLRILLAQAPPSVAEWMCPHSVGTADVTFDHHYLIIAGRKTA